MAQTSRVADYLIEQVYDRGAKHIFFVPGTGCMHLTDALAKHKEVQAVSVHHEQAAAMAALSFAKYNQTLGACVVTTGCGGTNTMTGLLHAWQDSVPCVFISGQAQRSHTIRNSGLSLRQMGRQEADIIALVEPITKYAVMLNDPKEVAYHIEKAIYLAQEGRPGPVWIDVPLDIQNSLINPDELEHYVPEEKDKLFLEFSKEELKSIVEELNKAERPIVLAGNGIKLASALDEFNEFVEKFKIPVTYSRLGADLIETDNPLSIGMVGMLGASRAGNFALANSDLVLCLGCRLSIDTTGYDFDKFAREAKIIVIDIDEIEHSKNTVKIDKFVHADVKVFLKALNTQKINTTYENWTEKCKHWKDIFPVCTDEYRNSEMINMYYFTECLSEVLPEKATVVSDAGNAFFTTSPVLRLKKGQRSITSGGQAEMGYALPASIGIYCASQGPVIAINGDGSVMMNIQELGTISYYRFPIKICIMNNNGYSSIRHLQNNAFRGRTIGTDPSNGVGFPNFEKVADAFNMSYVKISGSDNLKEKIKDMLNMEGPVLCEVICKHEQEFLSVSTAFNSKKRLVNRPLEDLYPFLDRELFFTEMIVEPIDQ